jgi:hypothetical protein
MKSQLLSDVRSEMAFVRKTIKKEAFPHQAAKQAAD